MAQMRLFSAILVLTLLLVSTGDMGTKVAEARICEALSHKFRGLCFSSTNCGHVCQTEGFHGGTCRGFRRRCFCTKIC